MNKSESIKNLAAALAKFQGGIGAVVKDKKNPHFNNFFSSLDALTEAAKEGLSQNGLSVLQTTDLIDAKPVLVTTLAHSSGEWIDGRLSLMLDKVSSQGQGAAITYARRYAYAAILGLVSDEDDDAESAHGRNLRDNKTEEPKQHNNPASNAAPLPVRKLGVNRG